MLLFIVIYVIVVEVFIKWAQIAFN